MPAGQPFTHLCRQLARPPHAGRADLHLHTTASDGTYTPEEIIDLARRSGLAALAITDHDTLAGIASAQAASNHQIEIIPGVEITCRFRDKELHLLAYFVRVDDEPLNKALAALRRDRVVRFQEMVNRLRALGVRLEEDCAPAGANSLGRRHLAELLVKARRAGTVREAFQRYLGDRGRVTVPKKCLPVEEAIALVRGAGGIASWAHPSYDCTRDALLALKSHGMQALEACFPSCRPGRQRELRGLASELGLAITAGSDCHGPDLLHRAPGACSVSSEELEQLRSKVR